MQIVNFSDEPHATFLLVRQVCAKFLLSLAKVALIAALEPCVLLRLLWQHLDVPPGCLLPSLLLDMKPLLSLLVVHISVTLCLQGKKVMEADKSILEILSKVTPHKVMSTRPEQIWRQT
jgi:hypothetical protein